MPRKKRSEVRVEQPVETAGQLDPEAEESPGVIEQPEVKANRGPMSDTRRIVFSADFERYGYPPSSVRIGMRKIGLPDSETQLTGFDVDKQTARLLTTNVAGYKILRRKGE